MTPKVAMTMSNQTIGSDKSIMMCPMWIFEKNLESVLDSRSAVYFVDFGNIFS